MYTIGNIIVGIPITDAIMNVVENSDDEEVQHCISNGFGNGMSETFYHGSSPYMPGFCGVKLGSFSCVMDLPIKLPMIGDVRFVPTDTEEQQARDLIDELPDEIKKVMPPFGVYIVWSTS